MQLDHRPHPAVEAVARIEMTWCGDARTATEHALHIVRRLIQNGHVTGALNAGGWPVATVKEHVQ